MEIWLGKELFGLSQQLLVIKTFRLKIPGMGNSNMVMLFRPDLIKEMYNSDERIPKLPGDRRQFIINLYNCNYL